MFIVLLNAFITFLFYKWVTDIETTKLQSIHSHLLWPPRKTSSQIILVVTDDFGGIHFKKCYLFVVRQSEVTHPFEGIGWSRQATLLVSAQLCFLSSLTQPYSTQTSRYEVTPS